MTHDERTRIDGLDQRPEDIYIYIYTYIQVYISQSARSQTKYNYSDEAARPSSDPKSLVRMAPK
jgi:hypothetical protein